MNDQDTTLKMVKEVAATFVHERDWEKYHSPKSMSMNITCEAAELMELFMWKTTEKEAEEELIAKRQLVENEIADIFFALLDFCNRTQIDLTQAYIHKMALNAKKYPVPEK